MNLAGLIKGKAVKLVIFGALAGLVPLALEKMGVMDKIPMGYWGTVAVLFVAGMFLSGKIPYIPQALLIAAGIAVGTGFLSGRIGLGTGGTAEANAAIVG